MFFYLIPQYCYTLPNGSYFSYSGVSNIGNGFSASEPVLHSAADPFLPISHSNSFYGSTATDNYVSIVKHFCPLQSFQCCAFYSDSIPRFTYMYCTEIGKEDGSADLKVML